MAKWRRSDSTYRRYKAILNKYFSFNFKTPKKGKEFTPAQKSLIVRRYKKISELHSGIEKNQVSFIPFPSSPKKSLLKHVDGVRTNKGIFYKFPYAKAVFDKKIGKFVVVMRMPKANRRTRYQRDIFIPFPSWVNGDMSLMMEFAKLARDAYKPDFIRWSTKNQRVGNIIDFEFPEFEKYIIPTFISDDAGKINVVTDEKIPKKVLKKLDELNKDEVNSYYRIRKFQQKAGEDNKFYNGIFLIYFKI